MDEKYFNTLLGNAKKLYDKKKYGKALSIIESISESDVLKLEVEQ